MAVVPKKAATSCLRRAHRFLELADQEVPVKKVKNDLRRMALVMAVAAIDSYMHALVVRRIAEVRKSADLPKALAGIEIAFADLARLADASINAQRAKRQSRPWVQVKASLQQRLLKKTFQSYDQVATALAIAGIDKGWTKIVAELGQMAEATKLWLDRLVMRRHQIVHEGDMKRAARPRGLQFNTIDQSGAKQKVERMEKLIDAIDEVVSAN